jgi:hypothetical protein
MDDGREISLIRQSHPVQKAFEPLARFGLLGKGSRTKQKNPTK